MKKLPSFKLIAPYVTNAFLALIVFGGYQLLSWGRFLDPDGFYHIKASQLLSSGGLGAAFPWLQFSTWSTGYADQHYLYHWLITPVNSIELAPVSVVVLGVFCAVLFAVVLKQLQARAIWFWIILLLLGSVDFMFRVNLIKANVLSLILLLLGVLLTLYWQKKTQKRYLVALTVLGFVFSWSYGGFVFLPVLTGLYSVSLWITHRKIYIWPLVVSSAGIVLGLLLHPHGTNIFMLLWQQIIETGLGAGSAVPAGGEWLPSQLPWFSKTNVAVLIAWLSGALLYLWGPIKQKKLSWVELWLHLTTSVLLVFTLKHRRFIEYFVPFAVLAAAISFAPYMISIRWQNLKSALQQYWQIKAASGLLIAIFLTALAYNSSWLVHYARTGESVYRLQAVSEFLQSSTEPGELVINLQWDRFPELFYFNSSNRYVIGLDPTFNYVHNADLYWNWRRLADDAPDAFASAAEAAELIRTKYDAKYILVDTEHNSHLLELLMQGVEQDLAEISYKQGEEVVFMIK